MVVHFSLEFGSIRSLVWAANRDQPVQNGSTIQLRLEGNLGFTDSQGRQSWIYNGSTSVNSAAMLDTGQTLGHERPLCSNRMDGDYGTSRFMLVLQSDGNLILHPKGRRNLTPDLEYYSSGTDGAKPPLTVVFDHSGVLHQPIRQYTCSKNPNNAQSWTVVSKIPGDKDACHIPGICGLNGYCVLGTSSQGVTIIEEERAHLLSNKMLIGPMVIMNYSTLMNNNARRLVWPIVGVTLPFTESSNAGRRGTTTILFLLTIAVIVLSIKKKGRFHKVSSGIEKVETDPIPNLISFKYARLQEATHDFKEVLGRRGSFGSVYKGILDLGHRVEIAVKQLDKVVERGEKEFRTEVSVIGQTHHKNLVRLLGFCDEGDHRLLVCEFIQNGSLANFFFGPTRPNWSQRVQLALGIARGILYLHKECESPIIHCDIKPQNILLDKFYNPKVADFGLAKLLQQNETRTITTSRGTNGYVAPEWFRNVSV
ncbi:hypothetical protein AMTR_s00022p00195750 [Amborella trichopoda]|uniref:non-specific serine/threonine protein kinase n=1 Tax=Amborella trichopoda TaxID=13333 RepID=W1PUX3_AMBTC|nr:hypothetical protein AMTR_s00022p00195750 [Amborella trichopoda]